MGYLKTLLSTLLFTSLAFGAFPGDFPTDVAGGLVSPIVSGSMTFNNAGDTVADILTGAAQSLRLEATNNIIKFGNGTGAQTLSMHAGSSLDTLIKNEDNDGTISITGGGAADASNSRFIFYGGLHGSQAQDIELFNGVSNVLAYDFSAGSVQIFPLFTVGNNAAAEIELAAGATNAGLINMANNDGSIEVTGGTSAGNSRLELFGGSHGTRASDFELISATQGAVLGWDEDVTLLTLGDTSGTEVLINATGIGFHATAPVARPAAYTPTNVTPDRAYDANSTTLDEVADVLGTMIADLQAYGLMQ